MHPSDEGDQGAQPEVSSSSGPLPAELAAARVAVARADRKPARKASAVEGAVRATGAKVLALLDERDDRQARLEAVEKDQEDLAERERRRPRLGHRDDHHGRGLATYVYLFLAAGFVVAEWAVDRAALLALLLPLNLTLALALVMPAIKLLLAHFGGVNLKRAQSAVSVLEHGAREKCLGLACVVVGVAIAVAVGVVRAARRGLLGGVLLGAVALALFLAMTYASFLHHHHPSTEAGRAQRARWWARRRLADVEARVEKVGAALRSLRQRRVSLAGSRLTTYEAAEAGATDAWGERHPGQTMASYLEPAWVRQERRIAEGELPEHLNPVRVAAWVQRHDPRRGALAALAPGPVAGEEEEHPEAQGEDHQEDRDDQREATA